MRLVSLYGDMYTVYGDTHSMKILYILWKELSLDCNASIFFDIKCYNSCDPFRHRFPVALSCTNLVKRLYSVNGFERVEIRKPQLHSTEMCKTCKRNPEIFPFLSRRGTATL
ncbi:hypothetical protein PsorP6_005327 [Peronosclerospora sorghi]|uniref:Uncharacterized protein n=1 Tax=Peronosclerospora sorghi TaxID=230839 RepID=A0ACC0W636_9STRA|nr:hypothetical protein PsorP6_005327 [Peronosclerospora sorghi]